MSKKRRHRRPEGRPTQTVSCGGLQEVAAGQGRGWKIPSGVVIFGILAVGFLSYLNTFGTSFHFDDKKSIVENAAIGSLANIGAIWSFWPARFLTYFSFALNHQFHRFDVFGYHVVNFLIHVGASCCAWYLMRLLFKTPALKNDKAAPWASWIAFFAGLIFVSHPVQTEAVTYITQRATSLAGLMYLATVALYVRGRIWEIRGEEGSVRASIVASWACAGLAMFTKELVVTLPLAIVLVERLFFRGTKRSWPLWPYAAWVLLLIVIMVSSGTVDVAGMRRAGEPVLGISPYCYGLTQLRVLMTYLRLLILPVNQNLDYDFAACLTFFRLPVMGSFLVLAGLFVLAWRVRRTYPLASFCLFWFFLVLAPESSFLPIRDYIFEHRLYLAMFGFAVFLPALFFTLWGARRAGLIIVLGCVVVGAFSIAAYRRNTVWKDEMTILRDILRKSPDKARGHKGIAREYELMGDYALAIEEYRKSIALSSEVDEAAFNLANIYADQGQFDNALAAYNALLEAHPDFALGYQNRGWVRAKKGDLDLALADYDKALQLGLKSSFLMRERDSVYAQKKQQ